jgi:hypothetical protein
MSYNPNFIHKFTPNHPYLLFNKLSNFKLILKNFNLYSHPNIYRISKYSPSPTFFSNLSQISRCYTKHLKINSQSKNFGKNVNINKIPLQSSKPNIKKLLVVLILYLGINS